MSTESEKQEEETKTEAEAVLEAEAAAASSEAESGGDLFKQIESLQSELILKKDEILRTRAEMENFRKRTIRDKEELRKTATASVIEDLLPIIDNMKLGLQSSDIHPEAKVVAEGFQMVFSQMMSMLEQYGLKEINPEGIAFDPNFHESVAQEANDEVEVDHIIKIVRTGYTLHDKLLRAASVITSSGPAVEAESNEESNDSDSDTEEVAEDK